MTFARKLQVSALLAVLVVSLTLVPPQLESQQQKIYVAFIWHYHQPWYYSPDETYFVLPWVRMHSVGNYYKMAYILSKYPDVKVTFTFSGSLLEQVVDYVEGGKMDLREIISWRVVNGTLTKSDVFEMLKIPGGFFDINWKNMVERSPRYRELRDMVQQLWGECTQIAKAEDELVDCMVGRFTGGDLLSQNVVDLATLFNLLWIDPIVAREQYPAIYSLMNRAYTERNPSFTREDLRQVLLVHRDIMSRLLPAYRELVAKGQVELIPVPYSHPIAPLLADAGLSEDLEYHVVKSIELFQKYLNYTPRGVWPAEQAVNEYAVHAFKKAGMTWTVTDSTILTKTGASATTINELGLAWYIEFPEGRIYVFFRETTISNLISFNYGGWNQDQAVSDLVNRLLAYRAQAAGPRLVVIALDGENPWEHYPEFGTVFLTKLYARLSELQRQGLVETITPGEFAEKFPEAARELPQKTYAYLNLKGVDISDLPQNSYGDAYSDLPRATVTARLPEGSWAGGELAIWIGHRQENVALMWLIKAREDVFKALGVGGFRELYAKRPDVAKYLLKAEASDWWWWYGGDGGGSAAPFDPLFKAYLKRAYELSGLAPPLYLEVKAYPDGTPRGVLNAVPPKLLTEAIRVDGDLGDWAAAANRGEVVEAVVGRIVDRAYAAVNRTHVFFALRLAASSLDGIKVAVYFATPATSMSPYAPGFNVYPRNKPVDLGIHLAREVLVDPVKKTAVISSAAKGEWKPTGSAIIALGGSPGNYTIELAFSARDANLAQGELAYFAVVVYVNDEPVEWSSRLGLAYQIYVPRPPAELAGRVILSIEDPVGDDDGPGGYKYPQNPVFVPGVFDLTKFVVIDAGDKVILKFYFRNLGGNPWNGPNGWSMQQIHVFIKTTLPDPGNKSSLLNIEIAHGWHMALLVGPGWGAEPLPIGEKTGLYYYDKKDPVVQDGSLKPYADMAENAIVVEISKELLYDVENIDKWVWVVAVTSHDGYGSNRIRPFVVGGGEWQVGVPQEYALAVLKNVVPYVMDLLARTKEEQYSMLKSFDPATGALAKVYGIGYTVTTTTPPTQTPTTTPTTTPTETPTTTTEGTTTPTGLPATTPTTPGAWALPAWAIAVVAIVAVVAVILVAALKRGKQL